MASPSLCAICMDPVRGPKQGLVDCVLLCLSTRCGATIHHRCLAELANASDWLRCVICREDLPAEIAEDVLSCSAALVAAERARRSAQRDRRQAGGRLARTGGPPLGPPFVPGVRLSSPSARG